MGTQGKTKLVAIVDDDDLMRSALQGLLKTVGLSARTFASAEEFLSSGDQHQTACLIADIRMPGISGLDLQAKLNAERNAISCPLAAAFERKRFATLTDAIKSTIAAVPSDNRRAGRISPTSFSCREMILT